MEWSFRNSKLLKILAICATILLALSALALALFITFRHSPHPLQKAEQILASAPLIDGYNGFATKIREIARNDLRAFNFSKNLTQVHNWTRIRTDIPRLRAGKVGAQIWSAWAECYTSQHKDAVVITLEQIDVIKRMVANYSDDLEFVTTAEGITKAVEDGKIASLIAVDGGHSVQYSLGVLRSYYQLGVRVLTLTSDCSNPWAQSYELEMGNKSKHAQLPHLGLSSFGEKVIREMNRLGMMIDISLSSVATMRDAIIASRAPVVFTRSAAKHLCPKETNIPDDILWLIRQQKGLVMINFFPGYIKCGGTPATMQDVVDHLEHMRRLATVDSIGIGSSFDAFPGKIEGLEDVSKFPNLFAELVKTGNWSDEDLEKLAGQNFLRVFRMVEEVRDEHKHRDPLQDWMTKSELKKYTNLTSTCTGTGLKD